MYCTLWSKSDFVLDNVQNTQPFNDIFITAFTFNIFSFLHSCQIKAPQRKAHNCYESIGCVYEIQDLLVFIQGERIKRGLHNDTHTCTQTPPSAWAANEQAAALAALYLIYRTFVALDIYRGSGAMNFMQTPSKHSMPRAWGLLSRRHHKSFHAKINHFHWTHEHGEGEGGGAGWKNGREQGEGQAKGDMRFREKGVNIQGIPRG